MKYLTLEDTYEANAQRHDDRALWHERQGHPAEWAAGSRRKAARWRKRGEDLRRLMDWSIDIPGPLGEVLNKRVAAMSAEMTARLSAAIYGPGA